MYPIVRIYVLQKGHCCVNQQLRCHVFIQSSCHQCAGPPGTPQGPQCLAVMKSAFCMADTAARRNLAGIVQLGTSQLRDRT